MENTEREGAFATIQREGCYEPIGTECSLDHVLPDYMPEIRRILRVEAHPQKGGKYVDGEKVEFTGSVAYTLLYTDGEGRLSSVSLSADYSFLCPYRAQSEPTVYADTRVESTLCRLSGPRKISLKSTLKSRVHLLLPEELPAVAGGEGIELLPCHTSCRHITPFEGYALSLSDGLTVEGAAAEELRPLLSDAKLAVREVKAEGGSVRVRGEVFARLLLTKEDGEPLSYLRRLPFDEEIAAEGIGAADLLLCDGQIATIDLAIRDSEGGAELELICEGELSLLAVAELPIEGVKDAYSPLYPTHLSERSVSLCRIGGCFAGIFSVGGRGPLPEETAVSIPDAEGTVNALRVECENGRAVLCGEVKARLLLENAPSTEETPRGFSAYECVFPFRVETDIRPSANEAPRFDATCEVLYLRPRLERDGIAVDAEISVKVLAYCEENFTFVSAVTADKESPYPHRADEIAVLYPEAGESLWSLGKRAHASPEGICRLNDLPLPEGEDLASPHSLNGVGYLLVQ